MQSHSQHRRVLVNMHLPPIIANYKLSLVKQYFLMSMHVDNGIVCYKHINNGIGSYEHVNNGIVSYEHVDNGIVSYEHVDNGIVFL